MKKLKIAAVTTSRADYGLLYPLIKKIDEDDYFDFELVVTGTHLSDLHGRTIDVIKKDGFNIKSIVKMTGSTDTERDLCNSIGTGISTFSNYIHECEPGALIVLGDRYELWAVCIAAVIHKVPIIHLHGGEVTYGVIDDSIRHCVTKMASIHFPSIEAYGKRIIQMGEQHKNVYVVGALGIDNIKNISLMKKEELYEYTGVDFNKDIALMTYHPVTLDEYELSDLQVREILEALLETDLFTLITMPNSDTGGNKIYEVKKEYASLYPDNFKIVKNLGQQAYLSSMKYSKLMIGNSSSGIIESASFKLPVINIGDRQAGRYKAENIIDVDCSKKTILEAVEKSLGSDFTNSILKLENPYGDGNTAQRIIRILKSIDFTDKSNLLKKVFLDLDFIINKGRREEWKK